MTESLGRRLWLHCALALCAGVLAGLAQAPWYWTPLYPLALAGLYVLCSLGRGPGACALLGWCFGLGYFFVGVHWVGQAFLVDAERFAWMLPLAVGCLAGLLGAFSAIACAVAAWIGRGAAGRAFGFVAAWCALEWLRGVVFTGFPWHHAAYLWTARDEALQAAALLGPQLLGLIAAALAVSLGAVALAPSVQRRSALGCAAGMLILIACLWGYGHIRLQGAAAPAEASTVRLRIVQPAIAQRDKWRPELRDAHLAGYLKLNLSPADRPPTHLIWPETATPFLLLNDEPRRDLIARSLPPGAVLLTGTPRTEGGGANLRAYNSLVALDGRGRATLLYDKRHLVPFGEYLPFRGLLSQFGLDRLAVSPVDFSEGALPPVARVAGAPPVRPLICYEVIFPSEVGAKPRAGWLLNVTNDAWFGDSAGPRQHLAIARMRAVEQGLPLVRAANTGISAVIDPYGRVRASLDIGVRGVIDADLPSPLPEPTLYGRTGEIPFFILLAALLGATGLSWRRSGMP